MRKLNDFMDGAFEPFLPCQLADERTCSQHLRSVEQELFSSLRR